MNSLDMINKLSNMQELIDDIIDNLGSDNNSAIEAFSEIEDLMPEITMYFDELEAP